LGDRHERHRDRHLHDRESPLAGSDQEGPGQRRDHHALGQRQAGNARVVEPFEVGALPLGAARHGDPGRHDHFGAEQPGRRILQFAHVRPGHPPCDARRPGDQPQLQRRGAQQVLDMAPWAFLIAGIAILATGNTMSEFSQTIPSAGSFVTFIGRGMGARAPKTGAALAGLSYYMLLICYPVTVGAVVVFMGSWVASLAGWGNVGWLLVTLGGVALALPLYVLATNRAAFRPVKHVLIPLIGSAVLVYGVYEFVQPSQPPPANVFWAWILGIVLVAAVATAIVYMRRPGALQKAVTSGPEYIVPEAPGR
jgi:hypothetical protein